MVNYVGLERWSMYNLSAWHHTLFLALEHWMKKAWNEVQHYTNKVVADFYFDKWLPFENTFRNKPESREEYIEQIKAVHEMVPDLQFCRSSLIRCKPSAVYVEHRNCSCKGRSSCWMKIDYVNARWVFDKFVY